MEDFVGTEIGGCQIEALIGKGGMGAVYKGIQLSLKRPVAVKILSDAVKDNEQYISRFMREAQIIARVNHPNIIQIYDTGRKDDTYYILMEYVQGCSLSAVLKEEGSQSLDRAMDICIQAVKGLKAAWDNEVIHRSQAMYCNHHGRR